MDVLLDVAAGPLWGNGLGCGEGVGGAGWGHLHAAELAQEVIVLGGGGVNKKIMDPYVFMRVLHKGI